MVDTSELDIANINPFRYRSYYYDTETGWYYLNSRYYNPLLCRFITMASIEYLGASGSMLSLNLYAYCENNPIMYVASNKTQAFYITFAMVNINLNFSKSELEKFDFLVGAGTSPIGVSIDFPSIDKDLEDLFKGN